MKMRSRYLVRAIAFLGCIYQIKVNTGCMFGFDGSSQGIERILEQIVQNEKTQKLTHKEVRAYARCFLVLIPYLSNLNLRKSENFTVLMAALSAPGLPHYDRSFLASKLLEMLKEPESKSNDEFF